MESSLPHQRRFLGWDKSLPTSVAERLQGERGGVLVVVPTERSGRKLVDAASALGGQGAGVVFRCVTPDALFSPEGGGCASEALTYAAWCDVLMGARLERFRALFPVDPVERNPAWAFRIAVMFERARVALAEVGIGPAEASEQLPDAPRWRDFAQLLEDFTDALSQRGFNDSQLAKVEAARAAVPPDGVQKIVVAAVPDLGGLARLALERLSEHVPVEVWIYAPEEFAEGFSSWGEPVMDFWAGWESDSIDVDRSITVAADPEAQASIVADRIGDPRDGGGHGLGSADPEVTASLVPSLERAGHQATDPAGLALSRCAPGRLLQSVYSLQVEGGWQAFRELLQFPGLIPHLLPDGDGEVPTSRGLVEALDLLYDRHLPGSFEALQALVAPLPTGRFRRGVTPELAGIVSGVAGLLDSFQGAPLRDAVAGAFAVSGLASSRGAEEALALADEAGRASGARGGGLSLLVHLLDSSRSFLPDTGGGIVVLGWLELLWEDSPVLTVAGLNEGRVPEAIVGDPLLPEKARVLLGLRTNDQRLARDTYILEALAQARENDGAELHLIVGKTARDGTPLRPSRVLFSCCLEDLPDRTKRLFGEVDDSAVDIPPARDETGWALSPPPELPPSTELFPYLRVTHFGRFLSCPFRFFLHDGLGMEAADPRKAEMDALDFGTVVHLALEKLGTVEWARGSTDEVALAKLLTGTVERVVRDRFGDPPPVPVQLQLEIAKERLRKAAVVQAEEASSGWTIDAVEAPFAEEGGWEIAGVPVRGTIDRIERHSDGRLRVIDYKTSQSAIRPHDAHLAAVSSRSSRGVDDYPSWQVLTSPDGRAWRWKNLQLPLYCLWAREHYGGTPRIECGYFNLPVALGDTGIALWQEAAEPWLLDAALACAEGVIKAVRDCRFWPPDPRPEFDDFAVLSPSGPLEESVNEGAWEAAFARLARETEGRGEHV